MTTERPQRQSIRATYDSRDTGPAYHVTTRINTRTITFQRPIDDPFARTDVHLGWRDLLRGLCCRRLTVTVIIGGDVDRMNDVLELDDNTLLPNSTRRQTWNSHVSETLGRME
jgi:hypothetical protein